MQITYIHTPLPVQTPPKTYASTFLAFLDILGFKEIVYGYNHEELVKVYYNLISANVGMSVAAGKWKQVTLPNGESRVIPDTNEYRVNSLLISDSVILWTETDSMQSLVSLVACVRQMLTLNLSCHLPTRGAIVRGPVTFQNFTEVSKFHNSQQIVVGRAVVDAYRAEQGAEWMGCIITNDSVQRYSELAELHRPTVKDIVDVQSLREMHFITEYDVPFRDGIQRHWVIDWPHGYKSRPTEDTVRKSFAGHHKGVLDERVQRKIDHTINFLNAVRPTQAVPED